jgi:hypothetical protein
MLNGRVTTFSILSHPKPEFLLWHY